MATTTQASTSTGMDEASSKQAAPKRVAAGKKSIFAQSWPRVDLQSLERKLEDQLKAAQAGNTLVESALKDMKEPNSGHTAEEFQQALQTLLTYLLNIKHHPESNHYKRIGVHNPNFKWKVQRYLRTIRPPYALSASLRHATHEFVCIPLA